MWELLKNETIIRYFLKNDFKISEKLFFDGSTYKTERTYFKENRNEMQINNTTCHERLETGTRLVTEEKSFKQYQNLN